MNSTLTDDIDEAVATLQQFSQQQAQHTRTEVKHLADFAT